MSKILITLLEASDNNILPRNPDEVSPLFLTEIEIMLKSSEQMSLLRLPLEILDMVGEYLGKPALNALCRTCHATHRCFQSALFRYNVEIEGASGLFWAVVHNRPHIATTFLDDYGADINRIYLGEPFIFHAIRHCPAETAEHLLKYSQIDANLCAHSGESLLWFVVHHQRLSIAEALLSRPEIDLTHQDRVDHTFRSPWFYAARHDQVGIVRLFLDSGVDINAADVNGDTALHHAVRLGNTSVVTCLLQDGRITVNSRNAWDRTALHVAVHRLSYLKERSLSWAKEYTEYFYTIRLLLESGIDSNAADLSGSTAVHMLAGSNFPELVQLLLDRHNVELNAVDNGGRTPLAWASEGGSLSVMRLLLQHSGVSLSAQRHGEYTPLWLACRAGRLHMVEFLLQQDGIDVNQKCGTRASPLHVSITAGHTDVVKLLLGQEDRVDVNGRALEQGLTPLMLAASGGHEDIVRCLLEHPSINVNAVDASGRAALFWAASGGHHDAVRLLLGHPALRTRRWKDNQGRTAYAMAKEKGHTSVMFLFRAP